jgi:hypothetical protein
MTDTITTDEFREQLQAVDPASLTKEDIGTLIDLLKVAAKPAEDARLAAMEAAEDKRTAASDAAQLRYANIPAPAGATKVDPWYRFGAEGEWLRYFEGTRIGETGLAVGVGGWQHCDGKVEYSAQVLGDDVANLNATDARVLSERLAAAADELERLTGDAPPFM